MENTPPPNATRLHALIGAAMYEFPPCIIEYLEQRLTEYEKSRTTSGRGGHLRVVRDVTNPAPPRRAEHFADLKHHANVQVPVSTLLGLASILETLHTAQIGRQHGGAGSVIGEHAVEGLIMSGRALVTAAVDAPWSRS